MSVCVCVLAAGSETEMKRQQKKDTEHTQLVTDNYNPGL